jgi:hypothetical protein
MQRSTGRGPRTLLLFVALALIIVIIVIVTLWGRKMLFAQPKQPVPHIVIHKVDDCSQATGCKFPTGTGRSVTYHI